MLKIVGNFWCDFSLKFMLLSYETWPLVHLGFLWRRVSCQFHFLRETIANQTPKTMEILGGLCFLRFKVVMFSGSSWNCYIFCSWPSKTARLEKWMFQDVPSRMFAIGVIKILMRTFFLGWDSKSTIISSVFPGKDHCFIEDFQITNPGDSYFYSWLDLQGLESGTLHFISPSFWIVGSDATAPRRALWLVSIFVEGIRGYLPPQEIRPYWPSSTLLPGGVGFSQGVPLDVHDILLIPLVWGALRNLPWYQKADPVPEICALPTTNSKFAPQKKRPKPRKEKVFQPSIFRWKLAVSFREGNHPHLEYSKILSLIPLVLLDLIGGFSTHLTKYSSNWITLRPRILPTLSVLEKQKIRSAQGASWVPHWRCCWNNWSQIGRLWPDKWGWTRDH